MVKANSIVSPTLALKLAEDACRAIMNEFTPKELPPASRFHYHQGVFLYGMYRVWEITGKDEYFDYIQGYFDELIDDEGNLYFARDELDSIMAGILLFPLYEKTKDEKYLSAAKKLRYITETINRTTEDGFWHKDKYPYQMWLDGLFMAGPFLTEYGKHFQEPELLHTVLYQEKLMKKHLLDKKTGLIYHAWDEKKQQPWANSETGRSPEVWGRSAGWYGIALIDILEQLKGKKLGQETLIENLKAFISTIVRYQDEKTGLWYQIIDKGEREDNWLESSCSSLFVYTIAKAIKEGYIDETYLKSAESAFAGLVTHMVEVDEDGENFKLNGICIGTSAGKYDYYVSRPTSTNDLHGMGAFILGCMALRDIL